MAIILIKKKENDIKTHLYFRTFLNSAYNPAKIRSDVWLRWTHSFLRRLDHPYVVKFYGTSLLEKDGVTKVIMVLEKCKENLKNRIFNNRAFVPAETKDIANIKTVKRWAREISEALVFIHKEGVVHRDLTMENTLVCSEIIVKT